MFEAPLRDRRRAAARVPAAVVRRHGAAPRTRRSAPRASANEQLPLLRLLLEEHLDRHGVAAEIAWVCTPMARRCWAGLRPRVVVYDGIDGLPLAADARWYDAALLKSAQLVLADGPAMYEARCRQHPNVLCLPSAVDAAAFLAGLRGRPHRARCCRPSSCKVAIPGPRLATSASSMHGIDLALAGHHRIGRTGWQLVMAGPLVRRRCGAAAAPREPALAGAAALQPGALAGG
jgi:hypothetical protein